MSNGISINDYCDHPEDYKNASFLTPTTRDYWDSYCIQRQRTKAYKFPSSGFGSNFTADGFLNFIDGFMQPENLAIMSAVMGGIITLKMMKKSLKNYIENGASKETEEAAVEFVEAGGDVEMANMAVISQSLVGQTAFLDKSVVESVVGELEEATTEEAAEIAAESAANYGGKYAAEVLLEGAEIAGEAASAVGMAMVVVQITGMILDTWDPCGLNKELSADALQQFSTLFNQAFRKQILVSLESSRDSYGKVSYSSIWPIEYHAEQAALLPVKKKFYDKLLLKYQASYLNSLEYNSDGVKIKRVSRAEKASQKQNLITNDKLSGISSQVLSYLSDGNTVAENFLLKYWPIFLFLFLIFLYFMIFYKNNSLMKKK